MKIVAGAVVFVVACTYVWSFVWVFQRNERLAKSRWHQSYLKAKAGEDCYRSGGKPHVNFWTEAVDGCIMPAAQPSAGKAYAVECPCCKTMSPWAVEHKYCSTCVDRDCPCAGLTKPSRKED